MKEDSPEAMPRTKQQPPTYKSAEEDRTTLQDVARVAGVHHTTVSRSLRDDPQIAGATRKAIRDLADRMGYEPDPMLCALARYRQRKQEDSYHGTLAWLTISPDGLRRVQGTGFFANSVDWARRKGYRFEQFEIEPGGLTPTKVRRILIARGIRGILFPPQARSEMRLEMDLSGFSSVTIGNTLESPDLHRVGPAQYENSRMLAMRLHEQKNWRVGFYFPSNLDERTNGKFSAGFWRAQQEVPLARRGPIFLPPSYDEQEFMEWFRQHPMDVLVTTPRPIVEWFGKHGIRSPRDVILAFPGDPPHAGATYWVEENWEEIYRSAVDFLISQVERNSTGIPEHPRHVEVPGYLRVKRARGVVGL